MIMFFIYIGKMVRFYVIFCFLNLFGIVYIVIKIVRELIKSSYRLFNMIRMIDFDNIYF